LTDFSDFNASLQLHVSSGFANVGYNLDNSTIQFAEYTAPPTPYFYSPADILTVLEVGFGNVENSSSYLPSVYMVGFVASLVQTNSLIGVESGYEASIFRNILTIPLVYVNLLQFGNASDLPMDSLVSGYAAKSHYRVIISNYSLYTFTVLAIMAMCWSGCVLAYCWGLGNVEANMSHFAEMDFASKCVQGVLARKDLGIGEIFYGLGNTATTEVKERIKGKLLFLGAMKSDALFPSTEGTVVLSTAGEVEELIERKKYF